MLIQQKIFRLGSTTGNSCHKNDVLLLVINGNVTDILLSSLFRNYFQEEDYIKGYSLLSLYEIQEGQLVKGEAKLSVFNKNTGEQYGFSKIKNPSFQMNDKMFTDEEVNGFNNLILSELDKLRPVVIEEEQIDSSIVENYEVEKKNLIDNGYTEHSFENYRLFTPSLNGEDIAFLVKLTVEGIVKLDVQKTETSGSTGSPTYEFTENEQTKVVSLGEFGMKIENKISETVEN